MRDGRQAKVRERDREQGRAANKKNDTAGAGAPRASCRILIDFSLANSGLDFISPGKKTTSQSMAGTLVLFPPKGQISTSLLLKKKGWIQS